MKELYKLFFFGDSRSAKMYGVCFWIILPFFFKAQTSYTFTNCGATGRFGPSQNQVSVAYAVTNLNGLVSTTSPTSGIQTFTIPTGIHKINIEASGAEGGPVLPKFGGKGATMKGTFNVSPGQVLNIVVGQMGLAQGTNNCNGGGGGGGTFVYLIGTGQPMIAAGGGGGGHLFLGPGCSGIISPTACTSENSSGTPGNSGSGGGSGACGSGWPGGGGAGWLTAGGSTCLWSGLATEGGSSQFSWLGGKRNLSTTQGSQSQDGSFGGGGAAFHGAGGGGGYSGGGGGGSCYTDEKPLGGGGGSYNAGSDQQNLSGVNSGNGKVIITLINMELTVIQTGTIQCHGQMTGALSASVIGGTSPYSYSWSPYGGTSSTAVNLGAGVYTVKVTDANFISLSSSFTITQPPAISGSASNNTVCNGSTVTLTGSGASSYTWSGGVINGVAFTPTISASYTMTGTNTLTACSNTAVVNVAVVPCTGINEPEDLTYEYKVYPNPCNGDFTIELKNGLEKKVEIYDFTGKLIFTSASSNHLININIALFVNGVYCVKVQSNHAVKFIKIIKQ